jgi:hypothetical protein
MTTNTKLPSTHGHAASFARLASIPLLLVALATMPVEAQENRTRPRVGVSRGAGAYFGVDLRVAVLAGYTRSTGRAGPVFSFDIHPTWLGDDALVTMLLGIGCEVS